MLKNAWNYLLLQSVRAYLNSLSYLAPQAAGRLAYKLFCTPRAGRPGDTDTRILETAEQQTVTLAGQSIRLYHWPGTGKKVFLLHGWESNSARWKDFLPVLQQQNLDIWALDAPGHGHSGGKRFTVPLYATVMREAFEIHQPEAIVGHSAGGMACVLYLSQNQPDFLQQLILLATPSELIELADLYRRTLGLSARLIDQMGAIFEARFSIPINTFSIREMAKKIEVPGLIIHDQEDDIAPFADAKAIHQNWPQARLVSTEGLGHSLMGPEVIEQISQCLKSEMLSIK
ncbi:MAG: alpha/beta hydrolase [Saprospiraceae bacterium]|nr:MAG: alpha/beta hydrolase [Saprospiraceae bacterium]